MIGVVLVAHGNLASEFLAVAQHILGAQSSVDAISILGDEDRAAVRQRIKDTVQSLDKGRGVIILTDLAGASPFNLCDAARAQAETRILFGMNLPMVLQILRDRQKPMDIAIENALKAGKTYMNASPP